MDSPSEPPRMAVRGGSFSITAETTFAAFAHGCNNIFDKYKLLFYFMAYFLENLLNLRRMTMSIEEHTITILLGKESCYVLRLLLHSLGASCSDLRYMGQCQSKYHISEIFRPAFPSWPFGKPGSQKGTGSCRSVSGPD